MSSVPTASSKNEENSQLMKELEAVRAMNNSLKAYLEHLSTFRKNLMVMNENYKQLSYVNSEWIQVINRMK